MSRLIFLNLPPGLTPESFKSKLSEPKTLKDAVVTDTKLVTKRRFAFVGYASEAEATKAKEWFDGSFAFGGGKVKVDFVRDEPLAPKPAKRARTDKADKEEVVDDKPKKVGKNLQEFMDVMKGVDVTKPTAEAAVPGEAGWVAEGAPGAKQTKKRAEMEVDKEEEEEQEEGEAPEDDEDDDDAAWLAKRQARTLDEEEQAAPPVEPAMDPEDALILSTGRLFVRNLAFVATADDLREEFGRFGPVVDVHMPVSQKTGEPLGTAFVLFRNPEDALEARAKLDKMTFKGRLLHVLPGRARPGQEASVVEAGKSTTDGKVLGKAAEQRGEVKARQEDKRAQASAKGLNWATLYMNSDAVAASVADRMGVSKADLLNSSEDDGISPAVKLALAETHVIAETKSYFEKEGIVLDSLQPRVPRSKTVILVKNIPYGTTIVQLQDLFAPHGELRRVLLPPAGTIGVVEYENAMDAGRAFRALAYRRMGSSVLYLEKGPVGMFKTEEKSTPASKEAAERAELEAKVAAAAEAARDQPAADDEAGSTLFLKNLAWATTTARLSSVLSTLPGFSFARVQTKPDPKRPGERLSMGYGFVGFKTKKDAQSALGGLQGFEVDGHALDAKFAQRGAEDDAAEVGKGKKKGAEGEMGGSTKSTKLLVKNLPFEATKKDVRALFSAYGTLKSLRLPKKATLSATGASSSRGFAFLEFTTHAEAQRAMDALKHTHLLGRHLVCQWANEGEGVDVDALREKVSRDARGDVVKKRKFDHGGRAEEDDGLEV